MRVVSGLDQRVKQVGSRVDKVWIKIRLGIRVGSQFNQGWIRVG